MYANTGQFVTPQPPANCPPCPQCGHGGAATASGAGWGAAGAGYCRCQQPPGWGLQASFAMPQLAVGFPGGYMGAPMMAGMPGMMPGMMPANPPQGPVVMAAAPQSADGAGWSWFWRIIFFLGAMVLIWFAFEVFSGRSTIFGWSPGPVLSSRPPTTSGPGFQFGFQSPSWGWQGGWNSQTNVPRPGTTPVDDGNYMFRLDHENKLIVVGRLPLSPEANVAILEWRANGYGTTYWSGTQPPAGGTSGTAPGVSAAKMRDLRDRLQTLRASVTEQSKHRFLDNELLQLKGAFDDALRVANEGVGAAGGR